MSDQSSSNQNPQYPPSPQYAQYPNIQPISYSTYNPYSATSPDSTWCKAAAITQIAVGALIALLAFCVLVGAALIASGAFPPEQQAELQAMTELGDGLKILLMIVGGCLSIPAIAYVVLGIFVWRRSMASIIISLVLTGCLLLLNVAQMLMAMFSGAGAAGMQAVCVNGLGIAILTALLVMLSLAIRDVRRLGSSQAAVMQQWQQYYQAQYQAQQTAQEAPPPVPPTPPNPPQDVPPAPPHSN